MGTYEKFFTLFDEPFRLTPDPRYLFLSGKHREVLAHMRLGMNESGGFVCITGDVGTGKTTLIRSFLDQLGPETAFAYIFNPPQSPLELLQTINSELELPATATSRKELVDGLNAFLLAQSEAGRRVLVVVDESQALAPEVLEELRLLSNLETRTAKLLQIVLFGQPQLADVLRSADLAQLNQRITLRWHLGPLDIRETASYVRHRLRVAGGGVERPLFSNRSLSRIHRYSGGVPRLVNILSHRCLLAAYAAEKPCVTVKIVEQVHDELQSVPMLPPRSARLLRPASALWAASGAVFAASIGWLMLQTGIFTQGSETVAPLVVPKIEASRTAPTPAPSANAIPAPIDPAQNASERVPQGRLALMTPVPSATNASRIPSASEDPPPATKLATASTVPVLKSLTSNQFSRLLASRTEADSTVAAIEEALARWGERSLEPRETTIPMDLDVIAARRNLRHLSISGTVNMIRVVNLPAILELLLPDTTGPRYAVLAGVDDESCILVLDGVAMRVERSFLDRHWLGQAHIVWRDFENLAPTIRKGAMGPRVRRLQRLLAQLGFFSAPDTGIFDNQTEIAVVRFQQDHRLFVDAIVGQLTRIALYGAFQAQYEQPQLVTNHLDDRGAGT